MQRQEINGFEFGPFRIDQRERLLRRGTDVIPLPPKALDTLLVLVASQGRAVEKHELLKQVWPDTFVEEGVLVQNVSLLRKTLEAGSKSKYIETIATKGYRFVVPVKEIRPEHPAGRSLAVLPLDNLSRDAEQDFFADGMTDELINQLMNIEALRVCSRTSVMAYKGANKPLGQVARELGVEWVVEGAVLHSGGRVRITVRVIDGGTGKRIWHGEFEKSLRDILALQSEVAHDIAREIRVKVTGPEQARLAGVRPVNPEAYEAYLRGRYFWNKRTREDLRRRALQYFREAIDKDPTYAPAHAGLADTYALLGTVGYDDMAPREAMPRAKAAAKRALEIDETLAEAHTSLGYVKLAYDWDWPGAEREFKRSLELNPDYASAHRWYAHHFMAIHRLEEAEREVRRSLELDPLSIPCNLGVGWCLYYARRYDQAIDQYRKLLEIAPDLPHAFYQLGLAYQNKKLYREALEEYQRADKFSGGEAPAAMMLLGHVHGLLGQREEACKQIIRLQETSKQRYVPAIYTAFIYAGLDERDLAFQWFEKAYEDRSNYLIYLNVEPSLDNLRPDPRYQRLLERIGLLIHPPESP